MPDGREFVFNTHGALWRLDAIRGGTPVRLPFVGQDGTTPIVTRTPEGWLRLVYVRSYSDANVWRIDVPVAGQPASSPPVSALASTRLDWHAQLAPDGKQLTFFSNRSGEYELWVAGTDGSNAVQVTSLGILPGYPHWSPDGKLITFHGDPQSRADVLVVPAGGGKPKVLTANGPGGAFPNFSRDGKWIYYTGGEQSPRVFKMPVSGGDSVQVTSGAAQIPIESYDGRDLYYVDAADRPAGLWRLPLTGGAAVKVLDGVILGLYSVTERGIYYVNRTAGETGGFFTDRPGGETRLQYFDFSTKASTTVATNLGTVSIGLSASRDGRTIFFTRIDSSVDELMLVEHFK